MPLALSACGGEEGNGTGGGDGGTGGGASPPPDDRSILSRFFVESFAQFEEAAQQLIEQSPRYLVQQNQWYFDENENGEYDPGSETLHTTYPLKSSGVYYAHAAGLTGAGQVIAVTDGGFLSTHEVFAGKTIYHAGGSGVEDHGTFVASVAAGDSGSMIGMAPGADLAFGSFESFETLADATRLADQLGAVAQNNSWGYVNAPVSQTTFDQVFYSNASQDYLSALRTYGETGVVIFAASNSEDDAQAGLMPALPVIEPGLEDGWLAVINGDAELVGDDVVAADRLSAGCLEAAAWCLAAEGVWVGATAAATDSYGFSIGTSFAAPMVAGAMAILGEAFPDLSPHDLRIRLLASADNSFTGFNATGEVELVNDFTHEISDEWGHGFLDVKAALLPIGETTATMADGSTYNVEDPLIVEGGATGDAVARALTGVSLAVDDALAAQFSLPAETLVARRQETSLSTELQRNWLSGGERACCGMADYYQKTRLLSVGAEDLTLNLMLPAAGTDSGGYGIMIGRTFESGIGDVSVSLSVGRDGGDLLPTWYSGGGSTIMAGELALTAPITSGTQLELAAGIGGSPGSGAGGPAGNAAVNSATAALVTRDLFEAGDNLSFTLGLPVAVTQGRASVTLPVATRSGTKEYRSIDMDLAPEDREVRFGIEYEYPLGGNADVVLSAVHAENFANISGNRDTGMFFGFRSRF